MGNKLMINKLQKVKEPFLDALQIDLPWKGIGSIAVHYEPITTEYQIIAKDMLSFDVGMEYVTTLPFDAMFENRDYEKVRNKLIKLMEDTKENESCGQQATNNS